jgi:hypothetical protein
MIRRRKRSGITEKRTGEKSSRNTDNGNRRRLNKWRRSRKA